MLNQSNLATPAESVPNILAERSQGAKMSEAQRVVARRMLAKMTGQNDHRDRGDLRNLKNRMY